MNKRIKIASIERVESPQNGQALVETMIVLIVFLILMLSVNLSLNLSKTQDDMLTRGLSMAISSARGATLHDVQEVQIYHDQLVHHGSSQIFPGISSATTAMKELGMMNNAWSTMTSKQSIPIHNFLQTVSFKDHLVLTTSVHIKGFPSHASDANDVIKHLSQTTNVWGKPSDMTRRLSQLVSVQAHLTDKAWKRPGPSTDLLSSWKDWSH